MMDPQASGLTDQIVAAVRNDFPEAEMQTVLWLLQECDDGERAGVLTDADGDLATLVLAVEDRVRLSLLASSR
jgi:hypothetical protein